MMKIEFHEKNMDTCANCGSDTTNGEIYDELVLDVDFNSEIMKVKDVLSMIFKIEPHDCGVCKTCGESLSYLSKYFTEFNALRNNSSHLTNEIKKLDMIIQKYKGDNPVTIHMDPVVAQTMDPMEIFDELESDFSENPSTSTSTEYDSGSTQTTQDSLSTQIFTKSSGADVTSEVYDTEWYDKRKVRPYISPSITASFTNVNPPQNLTFSINRGNGNGMPPTYSTSVPPSLECGRCKMKFVYPAGLLIHKRKCGKILRKATLQEIQYPGPGKQLNKDINSWKVVECKSLTPPTNSSNSSLAIPKTVEVDTTNEQLRKSTRILQKKDNSVKNEISKKLTGSSKKSSKHVPEVQVQAAAEIKPHKQLLGCSRCAEVFNSERRLRRHKLKHNTRSRYTVRLN